MKCNCGSSKAEVNATFYVRDLECLKIDMKRATAKGIYAKILKAAKVEIDYFYVTCAECDDCEYSLDMKKNTILPPLPEPDEREELEFQIKKLQRQLANL